MKEGETSQSPPNSAQGWIQAGKLHDSVRAYGLAKQAMAVGSEVYGTQYGLKWLHCILATMYGPFDHLEPDRSHFVGGMLARAMREQREGRDKFTVWGTPDTIRECLYVDHQIEALLAGATTEGERIHRVVKFPVFDAAGGVAGIGGIATDITERKRSEQALVEQRTLLAEAQKVAGLGCWALGDRHRYGVR